MQFKKRFFPLDGALIGLALLLSLQITRADPYIQIRLFNEIWWDDVGGEEKDYCQTAKTLYADQNVLAIRDYQWYHKTFWRWMPPYCVAPWPNEEQAIEGATSRTYLPTESGRYRCLVTENDGQSYYTDYVYIYIHEPGLTISQEIQQLHINACSGDEVSLTFVVHDDKVDCQYRVNYAWQVNYGTEWESISGANSSTYEFSPDRDGTYRCIASGACDEIQSSQVSVDFSPLPTVSLGANKHICSGESIVLDPGEFQAYEWSTGEVSRSIEVSEEGNYTVTVTDENGCRNHADVHIYLDPPLTGVDLGPDRSYCLKDEPSLVADPGYDAYLWSDGSTDRILNTDSSGTYWVKVSKFNTVCTASDTVNLTIIADAFDGDNICVVTVDSASGKNLVVWEKTPGMGIELYKIYRETTINQYKEIGEVFANELSVFLDQEVSPKNQAYLYKIQAIDTCGNATDLENTPYHKPIFLQQLPSEDVGVYLNWTDYTIQGISDIGQYLTSYEIWRGSDSTDLQFYKELGTSNYYLDTDASALETKYWYRVFGILKDPCVPSEASKAGTSPYLYALSNLDDNKKIVSGWQSLKVPDRFEIYPNPVREKATVRFDNPMGKKFTLRVFDLSGKVVRTMTDIKTGEFVLYRDDLRSGFYQIELVGEKTFRAKMVIK